MIVSTSAPDTPNRSRAQSPTVSSPVFVGPSASWPAAGIRLSIAVAGYAAATGKRLDLTVPMDTDTFDPVTHAPARLRIVATLAALADSDTLTFTRLHDVVDLTPGNLITHLRKLDDAGYVTSETTGNGRASLTSVALTRQGRAVLDAYVVTLPDLLGGL